MVIEGIQGLVIRPGDTLLIALYDQPTQAEADELRAQFVEKFTDTVKVVFIGGVVALAAYRPDAS